LVIQHSSALRDEVVHGNELGNLPSSQPGETKKQEK